VPSLCAASHIALFHAWTAVLGVKAAPTLSGECTSYLAAKGLKDVGALAQELRSGPDKPPCAQNSDAQQKYHPDPRPNMPGATDTSDLSCQWGHPEMSRFGGTCCGWKPHFNWIISTCEKTGAPGQFCKDMPDCITEGSPKINYVAAYQYNGSHYVLLDESSVGELNHQGITGSHHEGLGWEKHKHEKKWRGGDWTTKYAPWGEGPQGPRGVTPPGALFVLSAENFYYGAFYMLPQLSLNLDAMGQPTGTNCWTWELDPVEGTAGWNPGHTAGSVNQLYSTNSAQVSGCMPIAYTSTQTNGFRKNFSQPAIFREHCAKDPSEAGCRPWMSDGDISWSGGQGSSQRFENYWDTPYVFAIAVDRQGYWMYRWIPEEGSGTTGWPGINRKSADRILAPRPRPVKDPRGLRTDVRGDVKEAVILQPGMPPEAACLRASIESVNWAFGSQALGSMAYELDMDTGAGSQLAGAHNWWMAFDDTKQYADYPISIMGVPSKEMPQQHTCNSKETFSCTCRLPPQDASRSQTVTV